MEEKDLKNKLNALREYIRSLGSLAVAFFNLGDKPCTMSAIPHKLGLIGPQTVRDLWRQQDLKTIGDRDSWEIEVAPHGTAFYKFHPGITNIKLEGNFRKIK